MRRATVILLALLMPLLWCTPAPAALPPPAGPPAGITGRALFGGTASLLTQQRQLGRHLAIVRLYYTLGGKFTGLGPQVLASGSTVLVSMDVQGRGPSYAAIAAGRHDREILAFLSALEQAAVTGHVAAVYFCFQHEANNPHHAVLGTPSQFTAAYAHIHALAAAARLNWNTGGRIYWVVILMRFAYFTAAERPHWALRLGFAADYWPRAGTVDAVGVDGYNWGDCWSQGPRYRQPGSEALSPGSLWGPTLKFAAARNLPVFIAEYASIIYTAPTLQARFITAVQRYAQAHPRIRAASYFDQSSPRACDVSVNGRPASLAALAAMGRVLTGTVTGPR